jgi:hypothetical protein
MSGTKGVEVVKAKRWRGEETRRTAEVEKAVTARICTPGLLGDRKVPTRTAPAR